MVLQHKPAYYLLLMDHLTAIDVWLAKLVSGISLRLKISMDERRMTGYAPVILLSSTFAH